ncbi:M28 family peptidase [bacterium]|nr:M28 family peptidase [bacterium]
MISRRFVLLLTTLIFCGALQPLAAQIREDRTLLNWQQMNAIAQEASGERAIHNVMDQVAYQRVHPLSDYGPEAHFHESRVVKANAEKYGFSNVEIEQFQSGRGQDYQPTVGQLWQLGTLDRKIFDIYDTPVALASGSVNGDVTAEVVDVGSGNRAEDYEGKDVKGKIVLGSGRTSSLQRFGVFEHGAVGVLSYGSVYPIDQIDAMMSQSISAEGPDGQSGGFGWSITPRFGRELATKLSNGQTVTLRSIVEATTFPGELETIHATIPGDGSTDQTVFISGHIFEGYIKQGANDDNSGVALTLEMGRAYIQLVKEGKLPPPKRTIHFLWAAEISGTNAWLNAHPEMEKHAIADLNFDMEAIRLSTAGSFWVLHRTPDSFPTYLNDIGQSMMEFVAEGNRERVRFRADGYAFTWPVVSTNGSRDPFYIKIDKHYGSSDHVTYMQHGVPSLMFITWPDPWYHSSQDTPDKQDPTQYKRAAVVGIGSMAVLATADDPLAYRVANESLGRGAERLGANHRKGLGYMADATTGAELIEAYKEAKNAVRHQAYVEKAVVATTAALFNDPASSVATLAPLQKLIDERAENLNKEVTASFKIAAGIMGVPTAEPKPTELEKMAAKTMVEQVAGSGGRGRGGFGGASMSEEDRAAMAKVPGHMTAELRLLLAKGMTVMQIRDFLAGEFDPLPVADLMDYLKVQEKSGAIKLVVK